MFNSLNKHPLQRLCEACEHVMQEAASYNQLQQYQPNCNMFQKSYNQQYYHKIKRNGQAQQKRLLQQVYNLIKSHPKGYVSIEKLLKYTQIKQIIQNQFSVIQEVKEVKQKQQKNRKLMLKLISIKDQIGYINIAVNKYSKKLYANYKYVRFLDVQISKTNLSSVRKQYKLVYVQNLSEQIDQVQFLNIFGFNNIQLEQKENNKQESTGYKPNINRQQPQYNQIDIEGQIKVTFKINIDLYNRQQDQHQQDQAIQCVRQASHQCLYEKSKEEIQLSKQTQNQQLLRKISAWIYYSPKMNNTRNMVQISLKIDKIKNYIIDRRPALQYRYNIKIYTIQECESNKHLINDIVQTMDRLTINPYIQHHQQQKYTKTSILTYNNSLLFN